MDDVLDKAWDYIEIVLAYAVSLLDRMVSPFEVLGPAAVIFLLTFLVVLLTRFLSKYFVTKRYLALKEEFEHWHKIRKEALKHPDPDKGKALARNIDQAELNRAYYDYFFEGLLKNIAATILPVLLAAAYITTKYRPENLLDRFGSEWVLVISLGRTPIQFSSFFWFVICLILSFVIYAVVKNSFKKKRTFDAEPA
ncbi:MAG: hypothetical protein MI862_00230 [Desulfobacterales bacterium]|nr:hypothetical protein [Desulfobacterales bacterium]